MPVSDLAGARAALRDGKAAELLGLAECGWLDAKDGVYQLDAVLGFAILVALGISVSG